MVYCDQDMCESKLGRLMQAFRADRPSEWQMDEFIGMAEKMHEMNKELLAALEELDDCYSETSREELSRLGLVRHKSVRAYVSDIIEKAKAAS